MDHNPENGGIGGKEKLAGDQQVAEQHPAADAQITGDHETSKNSTGDICIWQLDSFEMSEKESVTRNFARNKAGDNQEKRRGEQQTTLKVFRFNFQSANQQPFERCQFRRASDWVEWGSLPLNSRSFGRKNKIAAHGKQEGGSGRGRGESRRFPVFTLDAEAL